MASRREVRKKAGLIARYFPDGLLRHIVDPRSTRGRAWKSHLPFLKAILVGLACGCRGLKDVEKLTKQMSRPVRKLLGITRTIPDTTLRDFVCKIDPDQISRVLYIVGYDAWRRKALRQDERFPFGILSLDGKYPSVRDIGDEEAGDVYEYLQVQHDKDKIATHGLIRTITATLIAAAGRPVLGAVPVPGDSNEVGVFKNVFAEMVRIYGGLFDLVMYDAGAASKANGKAVVDAKKNYFFQIANSKWVMYQTMELLFRDKPPSTVHEERVSSRKRIVRELTVLPAKKTRKSLTLWPHTKSIFKVYSETFEYGEVTGTKTRYFVSSLESTVLTADKFLELIIEILSRVVFRMSIG